jgi:sulfur dioxygenase
MIFRQLFEPISSTYTYLLGCQITGQAILIDPAIPACGYAGFPGT